MSEDAQRLRERYATIGTAFLAKVAQRLQTLEPADLSASDVARWTDVALKLEQAGRTHTPYDRDAKDRAQRIDHDGIETDRIEMEAETSG